MHQQVLAVRRTEPHFAYQAHEILMQAMYTKFYNGALPYLHYLVFQLLTCLLHYFLNTGRVDTSILHQALQRQPGYFPA